MPRYRNLRKAVPWYLGSKDMKLDLSEVKQLDNKYYWYDSVGKNIYLKDKNKTIKIKIVAYKNEKVWLSFEGKEVKISTTTLKNGGVSKLLKEDNYYKKVGDIVDTKTGKQVLKRVFSEENKNKKNKYVILKCMDCGEEHKSDFQDFMNNKIGCPYCRHRKASKKTSLLKTNPEMKKLIVDEKLLKELTNKSRKSIECKCPKCGKVQRKVVTYVANLGFHCEDCDNVIISYPQRYVYNFMKEFPFEVVCEKKFDWSLNLSTNHYLRYDIYIPELKTIIEVNGNQHYNESKFFLSLKKVQEKDKLKFQLAKDNGIVNYIEIDARNSNPQYIRNSICENEQMKSMVEKFNIDISNDDMWESISKKSKKGSHYLN